LGVSGCAAESQVLHSSLNVGLAKFFNRTCWKQSESGLDGEVMLLRQSCFVDLDFILNTDDFLETDFVKLLQQPFLPKNILISDLDLFSGQF
jgi:hypothetical protein